jgi:hypothetical protein
MLTEEVASVALNFGADDIDGTVGHERIAHDAGAQSPMKLAKDQIIRIIRDAGKIPVERDVFYNPLKLHADNVIGKIPYLNSVPFYHAFEKNEFKILPVVPRRMGMLQHDGQVVAGLFSLMDYFRNENDLELLGWTIATRDQVKSVMLFSNHGWSDLHGRRIGITDETATSVRLLQVLLEKKYGVQATFERLHAGVNDYAPSTRCSSSATRHSGGRRQASRLRNVYDLAVVRLEEDAVRLRRVGCPPQRSDGAGRQLRGSSPAPSPSRKTGTRRSGASTARGSASAARRLRSIWTGSTTSWASGSARR